MDVLYVIPMSPETQLQPKISTLMIEQKTIETLGLLSSQQHLEIYILKTRECLQAKVTAASTAGRQFIS
jgi:hypothetical protein